jgi:hypothetical protein
MEFGHHTGGAQTREVGGRLRVYCSQECGNNDEYAWVKFGMSYKQTQAYVDTDVS